MIARNATALCLTLSLLAACGQQDDKLPAKGKTAKPAISRDEAPIAAQTDQPGTPMAERVAVVGLLNKRNGQTRDFELKPGQSVRVGKVVIRVRACERTAPWETYPDQGAFVQVIVRERPRGTNDAERWAQIFSGWLFKENPAANIIQHPIYDVWVKECRMSFPGEEPAPGELAEPEKSGDKPEASSKSSAPQSPAAPARAKPEPEAPAEDDAADEAEGEATIET
jgi:hypothetical protein